ncbi:MAG TPA: class I SAM-dependent methyltransferase [Acidimicrobiales bacterium]|nr:class I SAM-dependent methyltransferase [Acidimicrobiales bacterium]
MGILDEIRSYWDTDAATYDDVPNHRPTAAAERAAWAGAMARLLPPPPARVLDVGAGTGFLSLIAARLGHKVTALDLSPGMLSKLRASADAEGLGVEIVEGQADEPPEGPFDAVMERHVLWTLPDPVGALRAWRASVPLGRLLLVEGIYGRVDPVEYARTYARNTLRKLARQPASHHAVYTPELAANLPLARGVEPSRLVELVSQAGWPDPWIERLHDVEWASRVSLPMPERLLGVSPRYVITAG